MSSGLYENRPQRASLIVNLLVVVNLAFGAAALFWWGSLVGYLDEPMTWATSRSIGARPDLTDYPYDLMWLMPPVVAMLAFAVQRGGKPHIARLIALFPVLLFSLICGWYYFMLDMS